MNHDMYEIAWMMGFGSSLVAWGLGPLLQQAWGLASDEGVRTMGLIVGLKFKAQMGLGILCHTLASLWFVPSS